MSSGDDNNANRQTHRIDGLDFARNQFEEIKSYMCVCGHVTIEPLEYTQHCSRCKVHHKHKQEQREILKSRIRNRKAP